MGPQQHWGKGELAAFPLGPRSGIPTSWKRGTSSWKGVPQAEPVVLLQQSLPINPAMGCTCEMPCLTASLLLFCIPWWGWDPLVLPERLPSQLMAPGPFHQGLPAWLKRESKAGEMGRAVLPSALPLLLNQTSPAQLWSP